MSDLPTAPGENHAPTEETWQPSARPWLAALGVILAVFMELLDTSIMNVVIPWGDAGRARYSWQSEGWSCTVPNWQFPGPTLPIHAKWREKAATSISKAIVDAMVSCLQLITPDPPAPAPERRGPAAL